MNAEQLSKVGSDLVRRCGTRDPFQIANALGINVMEIAKISDHSKVCTASSKETASSFSIRI